MKLRLTRADKLALLITLAILVLIISYGVKPLVLVYGRF
jgi:hypothetical protein